MKRGERQGTYRFSSPYIQVASDVRPLLNSICIEAILVVDHSVVSRSNLALQTCVRLQVKVESVDGCDASIHDGARQGVPILGGIGLLGRVETSMMAFAANHDRQLGTIWFPADIELFESIEYLRQLDG
jgi:hypothetical protein